MDAIWIVGIVIGLVVVMAIVPIALRSVRPELPESPSPTPTPTTARPLPASAAASTTSGLAPQIDAEIDRLIGAGQKIEAVTLLRDATGVGLKEAKNRVENWSIATPTEHTPSSVRASLSAPVASEIDRLIADDQRVAAIKVLCDRTGLGLRESKKLIDGWVLDRPR